MLKKLNENRRRFILTEKEAAEISQKVNEIDAEFQKKTADYKGENIWELGEFIRLLSLADNAHLGKSKAILYAYKIGYLAGQEKQEQKKAEQTPEEKQIYEYRINITRKLWDIDRVDILNYIKIITDDICKEWEKEGVEREKDN